VGTVQGEEITPVQTKTITLYTFDELEDRAKERARDWWRECEANDFEAPMEPIETAAKLLGVEFDTYGVPLMNGSTRRAPKVWWTLHQQGAGMSFDGWYRYAKGSAKAVRAEFPKDEALHRIADGLQALQRRYFYRLSARVGSGNGHYLRVSADDWVQEVEEELRELLGDFCHWAYRLIDAEWDWVMSAENVDECIQINEYTFTEAGKRED
jgi:hypothetical protein